MNNAKLEQLIDIDNRSITSGKKNFVADADKMLVSTFSNRLFHRDKVRFDLDLEKMKKISLLCLDNDSKSDREGSSTVQTTESINNETQEVIMHNN